LLPMLVACACAACASRAGGGFDLPAPEQRALAFQERLAPEDGSILSVVSVGVDKAFDDLDPAQQSRLDEAQWERARTTLAGRADLVTYSSDGLRIGALLVRPERIEGRRLGAVVFNRDGLAGTGLDENELLVELSRYAGEGYVAAASAYRGNRLSQGVDEFGGDDVNDVLALVALLQRLDYVDPARIFMVGVGRGGLMTYRALELGAPVRAAAVIGGIADVGELVEKDAALEDGFADGGGWPGFRGIYGRDWDYGVREEQLERRAPRFRAQDLTTPLLIVHGRIDEVVPVAQAQCVTTRMREAGVPVESIVYGYGDHALIPHREDWQARVFEWIERHETRALFN
jgi:dipeptidyl aminopeptidase/acylaminoacyl peptidase